MTPMIVGWGHTKFGRHEGTSLEELIHAAGREALDSAGVAAGDVDGIWLGHFNSGLIPDGFCSSMPLGIDPALRSNRQSAAKMPALQARPHFIVQSTRFAVAAFALRWLSAQKR